MTRRLAPGEHTLLRQRLESQWVLPVGGEERERPGGDGASRVAAVAGKLLALQAQDFGQSLWALGVRAPGTTRDDVSRAYDEGLIVRSWPMRGTLHITTADDLRWMLGVTATRTVASIAARYRALGLGDDDFRRARAAAAHELAGGGRASREEFTALLERAGVDTAGQRGVHLIGRLAHEGLICWGPTHGTQQALVLLDEWAPAGRTLSREEALGEFVLRYLRGHGPATLKDFCWWSKVTVAEARQGLARVRDQLGAVTIDGVEYLRALDAGTPAAPSASGRRGLGAQVLPGFDEYLLGYPSRQPALPEPYADRIVPGNNGVFLPMLVVDGVVRGTWRRRVTTSSVTVTLDPFEPLTATARRALERDFARYGRFLGLPVRIDEAVRIDETASADEATGAGS
ncbi:winged helix DNA-binding domain-containing protein [Herbiconiux solani]|uniref:winged helix DNA-binding domain-containing protein n=1 Tax=Herbiconiux solani TaxID=661329 RepID=UPI00082584F8|nr:winged helix DNA-binding domain-containing protein [Herbiconiux solani]